MESHGSIKDVGGRVGFEIGKMNGGLSEGIAMSTALFILKKLVVASTITRFLEYAKLAIANN